MMRKGRCKECGSIFYTSTNAKVCQDCSGDGYDNAKQKTKDAETIRSVNAAVTTASKQTVDVKTLQDKPENTQRKKPGPKPKATKGDTDASS